MIITTIKKTTNILQHTCFISSSYLVFFLFQSKTVKPEDKVSKIVKQNKKSETNVVVPSSSLKVVKFYMYKQLKLYIY